MAADLHAPRQVWAMLPKNFARRLAREGKIYAEDGRSASAARSIPEMFSGAT